MPLRLDRDLVVEAQAAAHRHALESRDGLRDALRRVLVHGRVARDDHDVLQRVAQLQRRLQDVEAALDVDIEEPVVTLSGRLQ